jgi:hypothetical protein
MREEVIKINFQFHILSEERYGWMDVSFFKSHFGLVENTSDGSDWVQSPAGTYW